MKTTKTYLERIYENRKDDTIGRREPTSNHHVFVSSNVIIERDRELYDSRLKYHNKKTNSHRSLGGFCEFICRHKDFKYAALHRIFKKIPDAYTSNTMIGMSTRDYVSIIRDVYETSPELFDKFRFSTSYKAEELYCFAIQPKYKFPPVIMGLSGSFDNVAKRIPDCGDGSLYAIMNEILLGGSVKSSLKKIIPSITNNEIKQVLKSKGSNIFKEYISVHVKTLGLNPVFGFYIKKLFSDVINATGLIDRINAIGFDIDRPRRSIFTITKEIERWFVLAIKMDKEMVSPDRISDIMDFIYNPSEIDWMGRSMHNILTGMQEWHRSINKRKNDLSWLHSSIKDYHKLSYFKNTTSVCGSVDIVELLSSNELREEGKNMHNCVGSYDTACVKGRSKIFSLTRTVKGLTKNIATIEISNKRIVQIKEKFNANASPATMKIISEFARIEDLTI